MDKVINLRLNFSRMIKIIYSCMILIAFIIPQEISAQEITYDSNNTLLEYKIQEMEKQINELTSDNKSLSSSIYTLRAKLDTTVDNLNNNNLVYDKVLESTKDSYSFLQDILIYAIGFVFILVIGSSWIVKIITSNYARSILSEKLKEMTGEGLSSEIEKLMKTENKNLRTKLEDFKKKDSTPSTEYKVIDEFTVIINKEYPKIEKDTKTVYSLEEYIQLARQCLNANAHEDVKQSLTEALQDYSSDSKIYILLGTINFYDGAYDIAEKYLNKAKEIEVDNSYLYHLFGRLYLCMNQKETAIENFEKAIKYGSNIIDDYLYLGEVYSKNGNILQLDRMYNQAVSLFPDDVRIYIALGNIYHTLGNFGRTKEMIEKIQYMSKK